MDNDWSLTVLTTSQTRDRIEVVIVDDDLYFLKDCREGLEVEGCLVTTFEDVTDAQTSIELGELDPDVFIVDVHFPGDRSGFDFVRWLRSIGNDAAVVIATSSDSTNEAFEAAKCGADSWMEKVQFN